MLSDILGDEDHLGDMDFKVAGTVDGVTSLQMDIKITSITKEIMEIAMEQAKEGRIHILIEMSKAITSSREVLADTAPKITTLKIKLEKHISFIDETYEGLRNPIEGVKRWLGR